MKLFQPVLLGVFASVCAAQDDTVSAVASNLESRMLRRDREQTSDNQADTNNKVPVGEALLRECANTYNRMKENQQKVDQEYAITMPLVEKFINIQMLNLLDSGAYITFD